MTDLPAAAERAFASHGAFERVDGEAAFAVTTTVFDAHATASEPETESEGGRTLRYELVVRVPMLSAAVADGAVGPAVEDGWFETLERRLEDAPMAVREPVDLAAFSVSAAGDEAVVTYTFERRGNADRAAAIAKAFVEYVEGTYVEGVVPGYDYTEPVASLLSNARQGGAEGDRGGTPL